jgi:hypothetical protein
MTPNPLPVDLRLVRRPAFIWSGVSQDIPVDARLMQAWREQDEIA